MSADELMQHYSGLSDDEKRKFDKRHRELKRFVKNLNAVADAFIHAHAKQKASR